MNAILATLTFAFLGSMHCVGMCGSVAALAQGSVILYQLGRLASYLSLFGIMRVFAMTTSELIESGSYLLVSRVLLVSSVLFLVSRVAGARWRLPKLPGLEQFMVFTRSKSGSKMFSLYLGVFTFFLPCGWLYGVLLFQVSLPQWEIGLLGVVAFWLGTMPALSFGQQLIKRFQIKWAVIPLCLVTLWVGWGRTESATHPKPGQMHCGHELTGSD